MPRFYRFGYQQPRYQAEWNGTAPQSTRASTTRGLGDVTDWSHRIDLIPDKDPYVLHKRNFERPAYFTVPRADDPYYINKYGRPMGLSPSRSEGQALKYGAVALAAYFLLIKKGAPLRKRIEKAIR